VNARFKIGAALALTACLAVLGCHAPAPRAPRGAPSAAVPATPAAGGREYRVSAEESLLTVLVYRGGPLAKSGHNHVIASHQLLGTISAPEDLTQTSFELRIPVTLMTVDEAQLREPLGADFPAQIPADAKEATRRNMLSDALLDGERYPGITLRSEHIAAVPGGFEVTLSIGIKDQTHSVTLPVTVERSGAVLRASGELSLRQSALGLKPFSVMLGALQVLDEIKVRVQIVARAT
jgi:polyisoprenoid-binding protein YceI